MCVSCLTDIPVFPTITATVTFQEFRYDEFEESIFFIPADYKEDPSRFPDLWSVNGDMASKFGSADKKKKRNIVLFYSVFISCEKEGAGGCWSYWSVVLLADGSKANQCKQVLQSATSHVDASGAVFVKSMIAFIVLAVQQSS